VCFRLALLIALVLPVANAVDRGAIAFGPVHDGRVEPALEREVAPVYAPRPTPTPVPVPVTARAVEPTLVRTATTPPTRPPAPVPAPPLPEPAALPGRWDRVPFVELGHIEIPKIGVDLGVREGVEQMVIDSGPAHWPGTAAFGAWGNVVLAGHRSSLTAPFRRAAELVAGDEIALSDASGRYVYRVTGIEVVANTALWIVDQHPGRVLTIFTCHPIGSSAQRLVVRAELVSAPRPE
jgi:sortase A